MLLVLDLAAERRALQLFGGRFVDAVREPLVFVVAHHIAVSDGGPTSPAPRPFGG